MGSKTQSEMLDTIKVLHDDGCSKTQSEQLDTIKVLHDDDRSQTQSELDTIKVLNDWKASHSKLVGLIESAFYDIMESTECYLDNPFFSYSTYYQLEDDDLAALTD